MLFGRKCMQWARPLRFDDAEMDQAYQSHRRLNVLQMCKLWCALQSLLFLALFFVRATKYKLWANPVPVIYVEQLLPLAIIALLALAIYTPGLRPYSEGLLCLSALSLVGIVIWQAHDMIGLELVVSQRDSLPDVWTELQTQDNGYLMIELRQYITREASRKHLTIAAVQLLLLFDLLQFIGVNVWFVLTYLSIPVTVALIANLSPQVDPNIPSLGNEELPPPSSTSTLLLGGICASFYMLVLQRRHFQADFVLQRALTREAQSLHDQMQREKALKRASEKADSVLNHILKNAMADAWGCIYLFESRAGADPGQLQQARRCLQRGMSWCRRREAILRMTSGSYTPTLVATDLQSFGADVVQGRNVACDIAPEVALLDPLACEIVLDNAVTNALRHGDGTSPTTLAISLQSLDEATGNRFRVVFEVTNCVRAEDPKLTEEFVNQMLHGPPVESESTVLENLGLRHMFMAAQVSGMAVSLQQEGEQVVFRASVEAVVLPHEAPEDPGVVEPPPPPLPSGVKIFCVDDSDVARRVLRHTFTKWVPGAVVRVFGETPAEVDQFMSEALLNSDIVVMDNHLAYNSVQLVGAHLLRDLLRAGYRGLACVRSANVSDADLVLYVQCGAHCILGKDVPPADMVQQICAAYAERVTGPRAPYGSPLVGRLPPVIPGEVYADGAADGVAPYRLAPHPAWTTHS